MSIINYSKREISYKVVLLGAWRREPGLVEALYNGIPPGCRGQLTALEEKGSKALFFDFLPGDIPPVRGFCIRLHISGWAGEPPGEAEIKLLLRGADGVVLFGTPEPLKAFIKTRFEEEKIPLLKMRDKTKPAQALNQILKKIIPSAENY